MQKNSFTLLETVISITILLITITIFHQISKNNLDEDRIFMLLNDLENKFNIKDYATFGKEYKSINILKNDSINENINVNVYFYNDENIKLFKYEK